MARILLVEDDAALRNALGQLLLAEGYEVTACPDGREALKALRTLKRPCCVVLDLVLPVIDGWEVMRAIREMPVLVPVVVISAQEGADAASPHVLQKPFEPAELLSKVRELVGAQG